jgi:carbon-monoxide dehydrogenase small subunit
MTMGAPIEVAITVNDVTYQRAIDPRKLLSDFLRDDLKLTGTHIGCEHGVCGACTVHLDGRPTRACLMFAVQADGERIDTVESLAHDSQLHPLQQAFHDNFGLQCSFCTPGILMTATHLLQRNPDPTTEQVRTELSGHLCRCTGYQSIVDSILTAAQQYRHERSNRPIGNTAPTSVSAEREQAQR